MRSPSEHYTVGSGAIRTDPAFELKARRAILAHLDRGRSAIGASKIHLVSYPRSGSTLVRQYFAILQGRPQYSVYDGDVAGRRTWPLTRALDHADIVKSHQMPADSGSMIYLVRDGRNAALSFLYMAFLFGGHKFSRLNEVYDGIRHLDKTEGCWADHIAQALRQSERRPVLFVKYENVVRDPQTAIAEMARFMEADLSAALIDSCVSRAKSLDAYGKNPYNGFLYQPEESSIYDLLQRHRDEDYWRYIFDDNSKRYFHDTGGTEFLLRFGYERSADWWRN